MSAIDIDVWLPIRKRFFMAKVGLDIRKANLAVGRAFGGGRHILSNRLGILTGASVGVVFALSFISYAVTNPPDSTSVSAALQKAVEPSPVEAVAIVKEEPPEQFVAPEPEDIEPLPVEPQEPLPEPATAALFPDGSPDLLNLPKPSYALPASVGGALYTLVVDKTRKELFVLQETKDNYRIVKRYPASLGEKRGDKIIRGDKKTPEGLYRIVRIREDSDLPDRYGPRAYVLNYPNEVDLGMSKTGDGIWIHGSGLGEETKNTKGCVEINDINIMDLGKFADVGSPVYIFPEKFELPIVNGAIQKNIIKPEILYGLKEWFAMTGESSDRQRAASLNASSGS